MKKNIVHYVTGQYMKQNKKRTFTTFLGIVFMVLLMTCVFVGRDTGFNFLEYVTSLKDGKWHVSFYDTNEKGLEEVQKLDYVEETALSVNYGTTEFPQSANADRPYLTVKAYTEKCFDWMNVELKEGRFPANGQELVISEDALDDGAKLKIGDTIDAEFFTRSITGIGEKKETIFPFFDMTVKTGETVEVPQNFPYYGEENPGIRENHIFTGEKGTYTVVGIIKKPDFEASGAAGYTAITGLEASRIKELPAFNLSIRCDLDRTPDLFGLDFQEKIPCSQMAYNNMLLAMSRSSQDTTMNMMIGFLMTFFTLLVMLASVVLIYNVFNISYRERSIYLGMLSSVGATARQKRSSIYYEAFVLLLPALAAGILLGMGVIKVGILSIRPLLAQFLNLGKYVNEAPVALKVTPKGILLTILVSTLTVLISAWLPARKIGKIGAIASIRGNEPDKKARQFRTKTPYGNKAPAERMLSRNLLKRQKKKTRSLTAAAVTFLVIMLVTSFGTSAVGKIVESRLNDVDKQNTFTTWNYGLYAIENQADSDTYQALKKEILENPSVTEGVEWREGMFVADVDAEVMSQQYREAEYEILNMYHHGNLSQKEFEDQYVSQSRKSVCIVSVDDETLKVLAERAGADYQLLKEKPSALIVKEGELSTKKIMVQGESVDGFRNFHINSMTDLKKGESFDTFVWSPETDETEKMSIEIAGFVTNKELEGYMEFSSQYLWLITGLDVSEEIRKFSDGKGMQNIIFYFSCDETDAEFLERLETFSESSEDFFIMKPNQSTNFSTALVKIVNVLAFCFLLAVSVICFLNLFNSIRGRMEERRGEFAALQSIGMTGTQLQRMLLLENLRILAKSFLIGGVISAAFIIFLKKVIVMIFGYVTLDVPWAVVILAVLLLTAVILLLTAGSFNKQKNENLLESIRSHSL